jgi:anti-anti-sigma factor
MIFVTVGTEQYQFNSLLDWVGILLDYGFIDEEVVVQYGSSTSLPNGVQGFKSLPEKDLKALIDRSRLVIAHCGEGTALLLEDLAKPYVLVPRMRRYGEHVDDHQVDLADALEKQGITIARSPSDLVKFLAAIDLADRLADYRSEVPNKQDSKAISGSKDLLLVKLNLAPEIFKFLQVTDLSRFASSGMLDFTESPEIRQLIDKNPAEHSLIAKYLSDRYDRISRLMLVCSSGGHYKLMQELESFWSNCANTCWVTFRTPTTMVELQDNRVYWAYSPTNRNLPNLIRNFFLSFQVLLKEKPEIVISTGAGVAVPFLIVAKYLCHSRTVFIEAKTRVKNLSLSARLLKLCHAVDELLVQSKQLADRYPKAKYVGNLEKDAGGDVQGNETSNLSIISFKDIVLVSMPKHLTIRESAKFRRSLEEICYIQYRKIVIDMGATQFIDSSGLGALIGVQKIAQASGNHVVLWSLQTQVVAVLEMTKLKEAFKIEPATLSIRIANDIEGKGAPSFHPSIHNPCKRAIDIVGALVGLAITAILFIPIAIAIKLSSPGPILFSQTRCGLMGKRFLICKFRSMVVNAEALKATVTNQAEGNFFKNENDPRITRVGRFLRRTSLDEFPQFWNVLMGDMSLVGTRPPTVAEVDNYHFDSYQLDPDTLVNEWRRLDVKPGITGEWQVHGRSSVRKFQDVVKLDLQYQKNWSLKYDLWLIAKTILVLFDRKNQAV